MSPITTHILDTARGLPAAGVPVVLRRLEGDSLTQVGGGVTDSDGRIRGLMWDLSLVSGEYQLSFDVAAYLSETGQKGFYPKVTIDFIVEDVSAHYHVPLLLSPYGYSTYRGS